MSLAFGIGELLVAIRTANVIRGLIGAYVVLGDIYSLTISSASFTEYLQEAYPDSWQDIMNTLGMISVIHGVTAGGGSLAYSTYNVNQATKFIAEVEVLELNPAAMERMTANEVNALQRTRERLLAELYVLRKNSATNQIIENEIRGYRDARNLQIPNAIRGTKQDWDTAKQTILDYRAIPGHNRGNYGYFEENINSNSAHNIIDRLTGDKIFMSAPVLETAFEPKIFTALNIGYSRVTDSEYRMLNKLAESLEPNAILGDVYLNYNGTIKIFSKRAYCTSCQGVIKQFNQMFPNINIVLIDATRP